MGALMRLQFCDVLPKQFDLAGIWQNFARDLVEQRGLAGTVGPEKQSPFAGADRHGYVLRYGRPTKDLFSRRSQGHICRFALSLAGLLQAAREPTNARHNAIGHDYHYEHKDEPEQHVPTIDVGSRHNF